MELQIIKGDFSICKITNINQIDLSNEILFIAKTPDEISLVCESAYIPPNAIQVENGWKALRLQGILEFGLVGVVANISNILADAGISIFVVSTYDTDYILMKTENFDRGLEFLAYKGYNISDGV